MVKKQYSNDENVRKDIEWIQAHIDDSVLKQMNVRCEIEEFERRRRGRQRSVVDFPLFAFALNLSTVPIFNHELSIELTLRLQPFVVVQHLLLQMLQLLSFR